MSENNKESSIKLDEKWPEHLEGSDQFPGIPNLGLTCFANCMMQVMNHTPAFVNHFRNSRCDCIEVRERKKAKTRLQKQIRERQQGRKRKQNNKKGNGKGRRRKQQSEKEDSDDVHSPVNDCYNCVVKEYVDQFERCHEANAPIRSEKFFGFVMRYTRQIRVDSMSDSEEFFMHLAAKLEESRNKIMYDVFFTEVARVTRCKTCDHEWSSVVQDRILLFKGSLMKRLADWSRAEDLDGKRTCDKCEVLKDCTEKTVIDSPPHVLWIKINFRYNLKTRRKAFENKSNFPAAVNIRPYMKVNEGPAVVYELYAVVIFSGIHYYSYCKAPSGRWNVCNDSTVAPVTLNHVLKSDPYALFYKRSPELDESWVEPTPSFSDEEDRDLSSSGDSEN